MSAFTSHLAVEPVMLADGKTWAYCLTEPLTWELGYQGSTLYVTVPAGFVTDLASIPRIFWSLLNGYAPETAKAAALHDWLRPTPEDIVAQVRPAWDVQSAAGEFYHALKAGSVPVWRRKVLYLAVVLFGTRRAEW